jgi:hypothetical protein
MPENASKVEEKKNFELETFHVLTYFPEMPWANISTVACDRPEGISLISNRFLLLRN